MPKLGKTVEEYVEELEEVEKDSKEIAHKMLKIIRNFVKDKKEANNNIENDVPDLAQLLYGLKSKVTEMALDEENGMPLGIDKYSTFIKNFLYDPIDAIKEQCDAKEEAYEDLLIAQATGNLAVPDADYEKKISENNAFRKTITDQRDIYDNMIKDKKDPWVERQSLNTRWFIRVFNAESGTNMLDALPNNKGGVFENFFKTTSKEYKEFAKRFDEFTKPGPGFGDLTGLKQAAIAYLGHKFPGDLFTEEVYTNLNEEKLNKMDATSRGRVELCRSVLETIEKVEEAIAAKKDPGEYVPEEINLEDYDMKNVLQQMMAQKQQDSVDLQNQIQDEVNENKNDNNIEIDEEQKDDIIIDDLESNNSI